MAVLKKELKMTSNVKTSNVKMEKTRIKPEKVDISSARAADCLLAF